MNIKNIRQYREFYKTEIRDSPTRDENFIGNFLIDKETGKKKFGWFEIYHGDKDGFGKAEAGIENYLQSFLDMAKDGQAVYEFLQNAVDAGSTHYTMVWGQDETDGNYYLLVANNGNMFNFDSIRSILNVGSSTKTADSQTIGKFGIGFKLAHRLVGKNNGLQELIHENSGPILFSWRNYELANLAKAEELVPFNIDYELTSANKYTIQDDNPWLFKILITCFPCLPENNRLTELPIMTNGEKAIDPPFSKSEYETLSRWAAANMHILTEETYRHGSLFFIKLGSGKEEELAEINLKEGVKFALAILKETADDDKKQQKVLNTVQINNESTITYPDLEYVKIVIDKMLERGIYAYVRFGMTDCADLTAEQQKSIENEANIEALFGFRRHNEIGDYFRGAPNLYLYFPLSEEVHNFNYILHSNAFYKGSSRTFLHKGSKEDGINERLLKTIVSKINIELNRLSKSGNDAEREHFLHFYAALLTSDKSNNQDRLWIEEPYIKKVDELLVKYIPVRRSEQTIQYSVTDRQGMVYLKKTEIDIDTDSWSLDIAWFYWPAENNPIFYEKAKAKLQLKDFSIADLLSARSGISSVLNGWIGADEARRKLVLAELCQLHTDVLKRNFFKDNFFALKIFNFTNGEQLSIDEFQAKEKAGYFLLFNRLNDIQDILTKLGLHYTTHNLDDDGFNKYFNFFGNDSQVKGHTILTKLFSAVVDDEKLALLTSEEKFRVFDAFRTLNDAPGERMGELKLFRNSLNKHVCLKNLYADSTIPWLKQFSIHPLEDKAQYKGYLVSEVPKLYESIIYPFWEQVATHIAARPENTSQVIEDLRRGYELSDWQQKAKFTLNLSKLIIYQSTVIESASIYFNEALLAFKGDDYLQVQNVALKYYQVHIPDSYLLPHLKLLPFNFTSVSIKPAIVKTQSSIEDVKALLVLTEKCEIDFFASNILSLQDNKYVIESGSGLKQIATDNVLLVRYVNTFHDANYELLPEEFKYASYRINLSGDKLIQHLIDLFKEGDLKKELSLIELVAKERIESKKALLTKLTRIPMDATWEREIDNTLYLALVASVGEKADDTELAAIHNKIAIAKSENEKICIGSINSGHDSIEVTKDQTKITLSQARILNLPTADNIMLIQEFSDEAVKRELLTHQLAQRIFKLSNTSITNELTVNFQKKLQNGKLENSHQLLFVLLSGNFSNEQIAKFSLKRNDDKWYFLHKQLVINTEENVGFIKPWALLHSCYNDLPLLLQLGTADAYSYGIDEADIILPRFLFVKGCAPHMLDGDSTLSDKLNYLLKGWTSPQFVTRWSMHKSDWSGFLSINPSNYVLNGIHVPEEILPFEFRDWGNNDNKKYLLFRALGISTEDSLIEKIRRFLILDSDELPQEIEWSKFSNILLLNTLNGLSGEYTHLNKRSVLFEKYQHSGQIALVEDVISELGRRKNESFPVLVYHNKSHFKVLHSDVDEIFSIEPNMHGKLLAYKENNLDLVYERFNIIKPSNLMQAGVIDDLEDLPFELEFVRSPGQLEHDEPFYRRWKEDRSIRIYRVPELLFDVAIGEGTDRIFAGRISNGFCYVEATEGIVHVFYSSQYTLEALAAELKKDNADIALNVEELIQKRNQMLASVYNALNAAGKGEVNDAHLDALNKVFAEEDLKQRRRDLIETIKTANNYSYEWFESYLNLLLTYESKQSTTMQKSIVFQEIRQYFINDQVSLNYFLLCGASSLIPLNIEDFEDFKITLVFPNRQKESVVVEGVSKRGQDLVIYCRQGIPSAIVSRFKNVVQVKIEFSPVIDLLERLVRAFKNRNYLDTWPEISDILPEIHFIYGPPGTGKTTTICGRVLDVMQQRQDVKILLLTPTNKAADVLCKKLLIAPQSTTDPISVKLEELRQNRRSVNVTRIGKPTDAELEDLNLGIYQESLSLATLNSTNILGSTIHRIPYFEVIDEDRGVNCKLFQMQDYWDYVIFDEASMTSLHYLVFSILSIFKTNPNAEFIIAGDPKQIPPIIDATDEELEQLEIQDENIYTMMHINSFKPSEQVLRPGDTITNLDTQFRSVKEIGQLFSNLSYDDLLNHKRAELNDRGRILPESFRQLINSNVTFLNVPVNKSNSVFAVNKLLYSSYHIYSAIFVAELVKYFDGLLSHDEKWSVGLIAPYKAQALLLNKLITSYGISEKLKIYADTVHGFQGDECDIIFFIVNPNNYYYTGHEKCLLSKQYIYNVAISRARDYLVIIHPFDTISGNPYINKIKNCYVANTGNNLSPSKSTDFESFIFENKFNIEQTCFFTGHDNINVFGQIEMRYFIKANESTIDIQLRK